MLNRNSWMTIFDISKESINLFADISKKSVKNIEYTIKAEVRDVVIIQTTFTNIISKEDYKAIGVMMQSDIEKRMSEKNFDEMLNNKPITDEVSVKSEDGEHV